MSCRGGASASACFTRLPPTRSAPTQPLRAGGGARQLPEVVVVLGLAADVVKAAKQDELALVAHHPVAAARGRSAAQRQLLPGEGGQVQAPQLLVVVELVLVGAGELAAKHQQVLLVRNGLRGGGAARRLGGGRSQATGLQAGGPGAARRAAAGVQAW